MMKITERWSVSKVMGYTLGFFDTRADAQAFAESVDFATNIHRVEIHEMVRG